jgi:hypothetical protein
MQLDKQPTIHLLAVSRAKKQRLYASQSNDRTVLRRSTLKLMVFGD